MTAQYSNEEMMRLLARRFRKLYDPTHAWADVHSMMVANAGLVSGWIAATHIPIHDPAIVDIVAGTTNLDINGANAGVAQEGLLAYLATGATGYFSHIDSDFLDITGTETNINDSGLTFMAWVYVSTAVASQRTILSKWNTLGDQRSYQLLVNSSGGVTFQISSAGTAGSVATVSTATGLVDDGTWYFVACRFTPSAELKVWLDLTPATNATSIPASIYAGTSTFYLGSATGGNSTLNGRLAYPCLYAAALPDEAIETFAAMTSPLFGRRL